MQLISTRRSNEKVLLFNCKTKTTFLVNSFFFAVRVSCTTCDTISKKKYLRDNLFSLNPELYGKRFRK